MNDLNSISFQNQVSSIQLYGVSVSKDKKEILHSLTTNFPSGMTIGLLGPSGSGKTTLMRAITGLQRISEGSIEVLDSPAGSASLRERISYSTQSASLYGDLTALENLNFYRALQSRNDFTVDELLGLVHLDHVKNHLGRTLSGGERTRLALATALVGSPELIILDEPTVGLDPVLRKELWNIFRQLTEQDKTLLISSHVMDEASNCDYIFLMREGRFIAHGAPQELITKSGASNMEEAFINLVNS